MKINKLINFLACPSCFSSKLILERNKIICHTCNSSYSVIDGVPILINEKNLNDQEKKQKNIYEKGYAVVSKENYQIENWNIGMCKRVFSVDQKERIKTYLDIGCGATGYMVIEAAKKNWLSFGIDISIELMLKAAFLAKKQNVEDTTGFLVASAEKKLPFRANSIDYVSALSVIEHLDNDIEVMHSTHRILRKKGLFYILVPNSYKRTYPFFWPLEYYVDKTTGHKRHYTIENLEESMKKADFKLERFYYNGHFVKIVTVASSVLKLKLIDDKMWWKIDEKDNNQNSLGLHLNAVFRKMK